MVTIPQNLQDELTGAVQARQDAVAADGVAQASASKAASDQSAAQTAHATADSLASSAIADITAWVQSGGQTPTPPASSPTSMKK